MKTPASTNNKIVQCFHKSDVTVRRAALNCIQSVVTKTNVKEIVQDLLTSIDELEHGVPPPQENTQIGEKSKPEENKQEKEEEKKSESKNRAEYDGEKLDDEDENTEGMVEEKTRKQIGFSDVDRSYRDLQIKTVLSILIDNDYENLDGDYQWGIEMILKLGVYQSKRVNKLVAETIRQMFIELDDQNRKEGVQKVIDSLLESVVIKKNSSEIRYSHEFLEAVCFIISENSFSVGAQNSSQILEYFRKHRETIETTMITTKASICELLFRLSFIELQNNVNKNRDTDIMLDRVKLFRNMIIESDNNVFNVDMRYTSYYNILNNIANTSQQMSEAGNSKKILELISDLEVLFNEEITVGGLNVQEEIEIPDFLDEPFKVNEEEFDFTTSKPEPKTLDSPTKLNGNSTNNIISPQESNESPERSSRVQETADKTGEDTLEQ